MGLDRAQLPGDVAGRRRQLRYSLEHQPGRSDTQEPAIPADEAARLEALRALEVLDTLPEERFDRLTRIARAVFGVPTALVSLVDEDRQWFKSRQGLDAEQTPRNVSFCGHAILGEQPFVVANALEDQRFADSPLVTGAPDIRFYAGVPLRSLDGHKLGTLCLLSPEPRQFSREEGQLLQDLAAIVEQELMSAELARARDAALAANRARSQFLANINHEIRTPLNAVIGLSEVLADSAAGEQREQVATIHNSGRALASLFGDLVDFSKLDLGEVELSEEAFDLHDLLGELRNEAVSLSADKGLQIEYDVTEDLPRRIRGDRRRRRQALANIIRFTTTGYVRIEAAPRQDCLEVAVIDSGVGMDAATLARAFDSFFQADTSDTRRHDGAGIGLSISRGLAELMKGTITATSKPGVGSTFTLRIPLLSEDGTDRRSTSAPRGLRVLVVDDNPVNLKILGLQLEKQGHDSTTVESARAALEAVSGSTFDLILMDIQMPEMSGTEAMQILRGTETWGARPIIAVTASADETERASFIEQGFTDLATKPVRNQVLAEKIARAFQN